MQSQDKNITGVDISTSTTTTSTTFCCYTSNNNNNDNVTSSIPQSNESSVKKSSSLEYDDVDKAYNVISDILFFLGSICYLTVAYWHASSSSSSSSNSNTNDFWSCRTIVQAGPVLYIGNATVEICWAVHNMRRHRGESQRRRGEATWDLFSNLFFGCGAVVDFIVAILTTSATTSTDILNLVDWNSLSIFLYFLSGLISVFGFNVSCSTPFQALVSTGDILFLIGSISDLILVLYSRNSSPSSGGSTIDSYWLISASLWLVNAMLYLIADLLAHISSKWRRRRTSGKNNKMNCDFQESFHTVDTMNSLDLVEELT